MTPALPDTSGAASRKVLLVDDNVDAADTMQALLDMDGFAVDVAYDGQAAVDAVRKARPDVVVMDIGMPGMNGYEAARLMRQLPAGPGDKAMVLVALTGWGESDDRSRASEAGFDHHLVKPVDYDALVQCLNKV